MKAVKVKQSSKAFEDSRLVKTKGSSHEDRHRNERVILDNREMTDRQRLEAFRMSLFNEQLPDLPAIPGYHVCWLTTTNNQDPIHGRLRIGFELIKADELPGMETISVKSGTYAGYIMVNEMIAAKIPMHLYQKYMEIRHHDEPLELASNLVQQTLEMQETLAKRRIKTQVGEGTLSLDHDPGAPDFGRLHGETKAPYKPFALEKRTELDRLTQEIDDDDDL